ncbi:MAG TPA: nuclear transport factor 2 family protein [Solirubrobacterales bacterium]|nr:nuclear transport factor 2 family protein [Solirubrobacterales bacterium]
MGERADLIRRIYGFDWAGVGSRRVGFAEVRDVVAPDFESRLSHELGDRVITGVEGLEVFVEALEQDFSEFHYDADEFVEVGEDGVLVIGRIFAKARATGMPLSGEFGHIWTVRNGLAAQVEAHRDPDEARRAAGA